MLGSPREPTAVQNAPLGRLWTTIVSPLLLCFAIPAVAFATRLPSNKVAAKEGHRPTVANAATSKASSLTRGKAGNVS